MVASSPTPPESSQELRAGAEALRYRDPGGAARLARRAVALAEAGQERRWGELVLASCLNRLPEELAAAHSLLERLLGEAGDERLRCAILHEQGENRALAGEADAALRSLTEALGLARRLAWGGREAAVLSRMGSVLASRGRLREALAYLLQALRHHEDEQKVPPELLEDAAAWELGTLYGRIAIVYSNLDDGERAIAHYEGALACFRDRFPLRAGRTLYRMGIAAEEHLKDLDAAEAYYRRTCEVLGVHGSRAGRGLGLGGLGRVLLERGSLPEAEATLVEALAALEGDVVHRPYLPDAVRTLGEVHLRLGRPRQALACFERALPLYLEDQRPAAHMAALHGSFYEAYLALENHQAALHHHELFHRLQMQHGQERADWRMAEMIVQFDTERALRERELTRLRSEQLEQEIAERRNAEAELARARDALEQMNRELHALTIRDPLTGIFNRRHLDERLAEAFALARRRGQPLSVMICDIDDFKAINDRYSHGAGDEVLRRVAEIIHQHVRQSDIVARFGGEEFVVLFPATDLVEAASGCEKLRALVDAHSWEEVAPGLAVTLSVGVAQADDQPDHGSLLLEADRRLYQAKRLGKNRVVAAGRVAQ